VSIVQQCNNSDCFTGEGDGFILFPTTLCGPYRIQSTLEILDELYKGFSSLGLARSMLQIHFYSASRIDSSLSKHAMPQPLQGIIVVIIKASRWHGILSIIQSIINSCSRALMPLRSSIRKFIASTIEKLLSDKKQNLSFQPKIHINESFWPRG